MSEDRNESCADLGMIRAIILHSPESSVATGSVQADSDEHLIALWLHGRPEHTLRAYRTEADRFVDYVGKPLRSVTLGDVQGYADHLGEADLMPASVHRAMSAVKSLFLLGFGWATSPSTSPAR